MAKELLMFIVTSFISASLVSSFLSISLFIRRCLTSLGFYCSTTLQAEREGEVAPIRFYEGSVRHVRRLPFKHTFEYPVRYALLDLDRCTAISSGSSYFPIPLHGHLTASEARSAAGTSGPVLLLTIPESVGYEQNPVSIFYCFERQQQSEDVSSKDDLFLKSCIVEVTNSPWNERSTFMFSPGKDEIAKSLHTSPFMDMLGNWRIHAEEPGEKLSVVVSVHHPELGNYFTAALKATRVSRSLSPPVVASFFWLMPHKVAFWIYWNAFKLWWKGASFMWHPKYLTPTYREEALARDRALQCPYSSVQKINNLQKQQGDGHPLSAHVNGEKKEDRWFIWREASWWP